MSDKPGLSRIHPQLRSLAVAVRSLKLDPDNARRHDERNVQAIVDSIEHSGFRSIVVVQKRGRVVRAGNGRVVAAKRLGMTHVPAIVCDDKDVDAVLHALADNRTSDLSDFDPDKLEAAIGKLVDVDADLSTLWTKDELADVFDADDEPAPPSERAPRVVSFVAGDDAADGKELARMALAGMERARACIEKCAGAAAIEAEKVLDEEIAKLRAALRARGKRKAKGKRK